MTFASGSSQYSEPQMAVATYETLMAYGREIKKKGPDAALPSIILSTQRKFLVQASGTQPTSVDKITSEFFRTDNWARQKAIIDDGAAIISSAEDDELVNLAIWSITQDQSLFVRCGTPDRVVQTFTRIQSEVREAKVQAERARQEQDARAFALDQALFHDLLAFETVATSNARNIGLETSDKKYYKFLKVDQTGERGVVVAFVEMNADGSLGADASAAVIKNTLEVARFMRDTERGQRLDALMTRLSRDPEYYKRYFSTEDDRHWQAFVSHLKSTKNIVSGIHKDHVRLVQRSIDALIEFGESDNTTLVVEKTPEGKQFLALKLREEGEPEVSREVDLFLLSEEGRAFFREMEGMLQETDDNLIEKLQAGFAKFKGQVSSTILFPDRPGEIDFDELVRQPYTPPAQSASRNEDRVSLRDPSSQPVSISDGGDSQVVEMGDMDPVRVVSPEERSRLAIQAYLANPSAYILRIVKIDNQNALEVISLAKGSWSEKRRKGQHPFAELGQISDTLISILQIQNLWANSKYWAEPENAKMKDLFMRHILEGHVEKLRSSGAFGKLCAALEKRGLIKPENSYWTVLEKIKEEFLSLLPQKGEIEKNYEQRVKAVKAIIALASAIENRDEEEEQLLQALVKQAKKDPAFLEKPELLTGSIEGIFGTRHNAQRPQAVDDALASFTDTSSQVELMRKLPLLRLEGLDVLVYLLGENAVDVAKLKKKEDELVTQQSASKTREALASYGRPSSEIDEKTSIPKPSLESEATVVPEKAGRREFIKVSSSSFILRSLWQMIERLFGYVHSDALETANFLTSEEGQAQISAMTADLTLRQRVKEQISRNYQTDGKRDEAGLQDLIERLPQPDSTPWLQSEISISKLSEKAVETRLRTHLGAKNFAILESQKPKFQKWTEYLYDLYEQDEIRDYADILVGLERLQVKLHTDLTAELRRLQVRDSVEYVTKVGRLTPAGQAKLQTLSGYATLLQLQETVARFAMGSDSFLFTRLIDTANAQQQRDAYPILRKLCDDGLESMSASRPSAKTLSMLEEGEGNMVIKSRIFLENALERMQAREEKTKIAFEEKKLKGYLFTTATLSFEQIKEVIEYIDKHPEFLQKILKKARGAELRNLLQNLKGLAEIVDGKEVVEKEATMFARAKMTSLKLENGNTKSLLFLARDLAGVASGLSNNELVMYAENVANIDEQEIIDLLLQTKIKPIFLDGNLSKLSWDEKRKVVELVAGNPENAQLAIDDIFRKGASPEQALLVYRNFAILDEMMETNERIDELRETINANVAGVILLAPLRKHTALKTEDFVDMVRVIAASNHGTLNEAFLSGTEIVEEKGTIVFKGDAPVVRSNIELLFEKTGPQNTKKIFPNRTDAFGPFLKFSREREAVQAYGTHLLRMLEERAMRVPGIVYEADILRPRVRDDDESSERSAEGSLDSAVEDGRAIRDLFADSPDHPAFMPKPDEVDLGTTSEGESDRSGSPIDSGFESRTPSPSIVDEAEPTDPFAALFRAATDKMELPRLSGKHRSFRNDGVQEVS